MNNFFRALIAGWGAKKLGGGCLSTIVIFIVIYVALGQCNQKSVGAPVPAKMKKHLIKAQPAAPKTVTH